MKFISLELEERFKNTIKYVSEKHNIYIDGFEYKNGSFNFEEEEDDDVIIDGMHILSVYLDECVDEFEVSVNDFIDLIEESKSAKIIDNYKCLSKKRVLIKIKGINYKDIISLELLLNDARYTMPLIETTIDENKITCSIVSGLTLFGIITNFNKNYSFMYPSVFQDDMFLEISFDNKSLNNYQIDTIFNSFLFELSASLGIGVEIEYREDISKNMWDECDMEYPPTRIRPLIYGEGINELLKLFNDANTYSRNYNYSIIQYTKIIEYVSQTIISEDITDKAMKKLNGSKALRPDANFVKELESLFIEHKNTFSKDTNATKVTIEKCCDYDEVFNLAPSYLKKIQSYKDNIANPKSKYNIEDGRQQAIKELCEAVSNTRNAISHAKANYTAKGSECPEEYKKEYMMMLKLIAIQVIRWYSNVSETKRIN